MRVFITGITGLIGRNLARRLAARGDEVVGLTRRLSRARSAGEAAPAEMVEGDPVAPGEWQARLDGCDAVVHLAGHNIFAERWNADVKRKLRDSRVFSTGNVVAAISRAKSPPRVLVQASAVGYYGPRGDETLTESSPPGDDFMARVCVDWEHAAAPAEALGARLVVVRIGVVLDRNEGALGVMTPLFKFGFGSPVGNDGHPLAPAKGRQWLSWIHLDDIVGIFLMALDNERASGPINGTAPQPVTNADFARELKRVIWRPYMPWRIGLPIGPPDWVLGLVLGEVAQVVTKGQRVVPQRVTELGYSFAYPELAGALTAIFARPVEGRRGPEAASTGAAPGRGSSS